MESQKPEKGSQDLSRGKERRGWGLLRKPAVSVFGVFLYAAAVVAGEVTVNYITDKEQPFKRLPKDGEQNLIKMYGEKQGKELWAQTVEMSKKNPMHYSVTLGNTDKIRKATSVDLLIEFYDGSAKKIGEQLSTFEIEIPPDESENVSIECDTYGDPCRNSYSLAATVKRTKWLELKFGNENEIAFEWNESRWFLENGWDRDKTLTVRSFSGTAYGDKDFDGKLFPASGVEADEKRFYRVVKEPIPGGYPENSDLYELNAFWHESLPGFIVENGQRKNPRFLDTQISNIKVEGTIAVGEYVQMKNAWTEKRSIEMALAPVCQVGPKHRALISKLRFVMAPDQVKDPASIEETIRPWLEPVSVGTVAKTCGPNSGRLVRRWDANTTIDQVEADLGPADSRIEVKGGEMLAYGNVRLKFIDGKLAGLERKAK